MISSVILFSTVLISVQCGLVDSVDSEISSIPLSELLSTFKRTHHDSVDAHLMFMLFIASYGDRMYNLPVDLSTECQRTARACTLMMQKLAVDDEVIMGALGTAVDRTTRDLRWSHCADESSKSIQTQLQAVYSKRRNKMQPVSQMSVLVHLISKNLSIKTTWF